jgi:hypothetical protein
MPVASFLIFLFISMVPPLSLRQLTSLLLGLLLPVLMGPFVVPTRYREVQNTTTLFFATIRYCTEFLWT